MHIRLKFHGAARTVTGSCYELETETARLLIDCGMFQGSKTERELNERHFPFSPAQIDALLLTHAHIDHAGLIPKLVKDGFDKSIWATPPTVDLCHAMLPDSGFIQENEAKFRNERNRKRGRDEVEPLYTLDDAEKALTLFKPIVYEEWQEPAPGIKARWWNAGHLLGSASIEIEVARPSEAPLRLLFSGDLGPDHKMLEHDPEAPQGFDVVVCESTYGNRDRFERGEDKRLELLAQEVNAAANRKGALLIPSFAVERTQEVVTDLVTLMERGLVPKTHIFIDSPLANKATAIFKKYAATLDHGAALTQAFTSPLVRSSETVEDSKAINKLLGFMIIVAASGMAEAGRIRHHLKNRLWQSSTTVLLVGYQAAGSLGQILESGAEMVRIQGEDIKVRATIRRFEDYSGHADGPELLQWLKERKPITKALFLTHGEEEAQRALESAILKEKIMAPGHVFRPALDECYALEGPSVALLTSETPPRIDPALLAQKDWHNERTSLHLSIDQELERLTDKASRDALIHKLRRALAQDQPPTQTKGR